MSHTVKSYLYLCCLFLCFTHTAMAGALNGFDLRSSIISHDEIHSGGPPRDGIPAINKPKFVTAHKASFVDPQDRVLGLNHRGQSRAYPISIMNWHEIVNDVVQDEAIAITYCPLCGSGVAFSSYVNQRKMTFGVSGLLYNSDVLLYDQETESLWSQLLRKAISGPLRNAKLTLLPLEHTRWADWRKRYPDTLVLSQDTGYRRDYNRDPYADYQNSEGIYFPVQHRDPRYHPKEKVLGIEVNGQYRAYPFAELSAMASKQDKVVIKDKFHHLDITVHYDVKSHSARIVDGSGYPMPAITVFWFAWIAFHPDTTVFQAK